MTVIKISSIDYGLQGEGLRTGSPTVFVRFYGCNKSCSFCDVKATEYTEIEVFEILSKVQDFGCPWVCITGGEPTQQHEGLLELCQKFMQHGFLMQIETNGTGEVPHLFDHITVSPKGKFRPEFRVLAREFKYIITNEEDLKTIDLNVSGQIWLQPDNNRTEIIKSCVDFLLKHPDLRLSLQTQKFI